MTDDADGDLTPRVKSFNTFFADSSAFDKRAECPRARASDPQRSVDADSSPTVDLTPSPTVDLVSTPHAQLVWGIGNIRDSPKGISTTANSSALADAGRGLCEPECSIFPPGQHHPCCSQAIFAGEALQDFLLTHGQPHSAAA